jgi:hypothetical protein
VAGSTADRLAAALVEAGAPRAMVDKARRGYYDDYRSELAMPISQLVTDARRKGLDDIARRAAEGEFDGTAEESDAWARSDEGQATFRALIGSTGRGKDTRRRPDLAASGEDLGYASGRDMAGPGDRSD